MKNGRINFLQQRQRADELEVNNILLQQGISQLSGKIIPLEKQVRDLQTHNAQLTADLARANEATTQAAQQAKTRAEQVRRLIALADYLGAPVGDKAIWWPEPGMPASAYVTDPVRWAEIADIVAPNGDEA